MQLDVIHTGNCHDILPTLDASKIDALITDPPYGINSYRSRGIPSKGVPLGDYRRFVGDDRPFDPAHLLGFRRVVMFGANYYADKLPISSYWLAWDKRDGSGYNGFADMELAWTNFSGPSRLHSQRWMGMIRNGEREKRIHPTQKPLRLMRWIIELTKLPVGSVILDPYAGSGSTLVAAKQMGMHYIGIEIDPKYVIAANRRLARAGHPLFAESAPCT